MFRPNPILCLDTGEVWYSARYAQENGNGDVIRAVRTERTAGGKCWIIAPFFLRDLYISKAKETGSRGPFLLADPREYEMQIMLTRAIRDPKRAQDFLINEKRDKMITLWATKGDEYRLQAKQRSEMLKKKLSDPEIRRKMSDAKNGKKRPVTNGDGKVYESSYSAERSTGARQSRISAECHGRKKGPWRFATPDEVASLVASR